MVLLSKESVNIEYFKETLFVLFATDGAVTFKPEFSRDCRATQVMQHHDVKPEPRAAALCAAKINERAQLS